MAMLDVPSTDLRTVAFLVDGIETGLKGRIYGVIRESAFQSYSSGTTGRLFRIGRVIMALHVLRLGVCGVIVASSLTLAACNEGNNAKPSSGTSTPSTASTTVASTAPSSPPPGPSAPAGDQASAEAAIKQGYVKKLAGCYATRNAVADLVAINWNPPGFKENEGGSGAIKDANPSLGGEFRATFADGRWKIVYNWC